MGLVAFDMRFKYILSCISICAYPVVTLGVYEFSLGYFHLCILRSIYMLLSIKETFYLFLIGSFRVKSTNASSMTISDFLHFAVYERHIIQEQNKKKLNLISPS